MEKPQDSQDPLVNLMVEQTLRAESLKMQYIAFIDMLGFSELTKKHPGSMTIEVGDDHTWLSTGTSKSAERLGRFHGILDRLAAEHYDASHPEQMMIFSDCAFAVYQNALQAVVSLAPVMRTLLGAAIPVRMGIAKGTCHFQRFGIDTYPAFRVTRSMFYGSGVVFATEAEKSGKGCRIFLHRSLDENDLALIRNNYPLLERLPPAEASTHEVNYLNDGSPAAGADFTSELDHRIWLGLAVLLNELNRPIDPSVRIHYDESYVAFNRMRKQRGQPEVAPPIFGDS